MHQVGDQVGGQVNALEPWASDPKGAADGPFPSDPSELGNTKGKKLICTSECLTARQGV
jgi:hypothetical protein